MANFRKQSERFGADLQTVKATRVDLSSRPFKVWVGDPQTPEPTHLAKSIIVATGARSLMLDVPGEAELIGHGVSTCATCDGFFFRNQPIAVIGGGDSAIEEALFLTKFATSVTVIHRRSELRASKIMQERARTNDRISFLWNTVVTEVLGTSKVTGLSIKNTLTGEASKLEVDGCFVAIGHSPNTSLFIDQLHHGSLTNVPGVFACGDVQDSSYRQAITAAGSGCMAAIDVERFLEGVPQ
jgi:thioredoxin reductase (NADPH)